MIGEIELDWGRSFKYGVDEEERIFVYEEDIYPCSFEWFER